MCCRNAPLEEAERRLERGASMKHDQDYAVMVIPIKRSLVFWETSEVCRYFEALRFDAQASFEMPYTNDSRRPGSWYSSHLRDRTAALEVPYLLVMMQMPQQQQQLQRDFRVLKCNYHQIFAPKHTIVYT